MLQSNIFRGMQERLKIINHHANALDMHIKAPQTKLLPALIPGGQHQAVLLEGESLEEVDRLKYLGPMFMANDQAAEVI